MKIRAFYCLIALGFMTATLPHTASAQSAVATVTSSVFPATPTWVDGVTGMLKIAGVSGQPAPTGSITYYVDSGSASSAPVSNGAAYLDLGQFAVGSHTLQTSYSGDTIYAASTQAALQFTVVDQAFALTGIEGIQFFYNGFNLQYLATDSNDTVYVSSPTDNKVVYMGVRDVTYTALPLRGTTAVDGLAFDTNDNLFIADNGNGNIYEYTRAGTQSTLPITGLASPTGLALDRTHHLLYIADVGNQRIVRYDLTHGGALTTVVSNLTALQSIAVDPAGTLYYTDHVAGYHHVDASGNDIPLYYNVSDTGGYIGMIYVDRNGLIYVSDTGYQILLRVDSLGHQTRISNGGNSAFGMTDDSQGRVYIPLGYGVDVISTGGLPRAADAQGTLNINGDTNQSINSAIYAMPQGLSSLATTYAPAVNFTAFAGTAPICLRVERWGSCYTQFAFNFTLPGTRVGNIVATYDGGPTLSSAFYGNDNGSGVAFAPGTPTASSTTAQAVAGVAFDQLGNYYAADASTSKVTQTNPTTGSTVTVPFTGLSHPTVLATDGLAATYVLDSGHNRIVKVTAAGSQTVPVTAGTSNALSAISSFALDGDAQIYYAGPAGTTTSIYLLDHTGATSVVVSGIGASVSIALDPYGDLYSLQQDGSILRFDPHRVQSTFAPASSFANPAGLAVDDSGSAYVIQRNSGTVTVLHPDTTVTAIPIAGLTNPVGLALDGRGSILTADLPTNNFIFVNRAHQDFIFGNVPLNATTTFAAFLSNTGVQPFDITGGLPGDSNFHQVTTVNACGSSTATTTLAAGTSCDLSYTVHPTTAGTLSASSRITTDSSTLGVDFDNFSATAVAAPLPILTPSTLTFSSTVGAASSAQQATLMNTGGAALTISSVTIGGAGAASFSQASTCGTSLAAGGSCTLAVSCTPTAVGTATATLSVNYPSPLAQQSVALSCTATAALVPQAALTAASANFGTVMAGTASDVQTFTLSNAGTASLTISSVALGGANPTAFALGANSCGTSLAAGGACTVAVTFRPPSAGSYSASLIVVDAVGTQSSALTGTGAPPAAPLAALSPSAGAFGSVTVGSTSAPLTFTLTNGGNAALSITSVSVGGTNAALFSVTADTCGTLLAADSSCTITDAFKPTAVGSDTATLSVLDSVGTQTAALTGTGAAAPVAADFGITATPATQTVVAGSSATYTVSLDSATGTFTQPVALTASGLPPGATVTFSPASVTPGSAGATTTMVIETTALNAANPLAWRGGAPMLAMLLFLPMGLSRRAWMRVSCWVAVVVAAGALQGCGNGGYALPQTLTAPPPVQSQTYTVTVTGTSGSTSHSVTVKLTVQSGPAA
jgi:sugar lactone lactonase YvrE